MKYSLDALREIKKRNAAIKQLSNEVDEIVNHEQIYQDAVEKERLTRESVGKVEGENG